MRAVAQRVCSARVITGDRVLGSTGPGVLLLLGIAHDDTKEEADWLLNKVLDLRIFEDEHGRFDASLRTVNGDLMVVSQFTLLADTRKGRRPSFSDAAPPSLAVPLYEYFVAQARKQGVRVATGEFGARMQVHLVNDGPVTLVLDSRRR
jgi:D-tyrosyl-tRNA(Tyr) deacylase